MAPSEPRRDLRRAAGTNRRARGVSRDTRWLIAALAGVIVLPLLASLALAVRTARADVLHRAAVYADDVLARSDRIAAGVRAGLDSLAAGDSNVEPCDPADLARMRFLALESSEVLLFGRVADEAIVCSSLGVHQPTLRIGPPDVVAFTGSALRNTVRLASFPSLSFTATERDGFIALIHKDLAVATTTFEPGVVLAMITPETRTVRSATGVVRDEWIDLGLSVEGASCVCDGFVVVTRRSDRFSALTVAAVPATVLEARIRESAGVAVPVALIAAALLVWGTLRFAASQRTMPNVVRGVLRQGTLAMQYQPMVELATGRWVGAEALLRCRDGAGAPIDPGLFVATAEQAGLMPAVTARVLHEVARDAAGLFTRRPDLHLAVNLAASNLADDRIVSALQEAMSRTGASRGNLIVEVTERELADAPTSRPRLAALRAMGVQVSVDDFGTGYANLAFLESFDLDYLKIDKSFVDTLGTDAPTSRVVHHIIELGHELGLDLVAEGVENEAQATRLRELGVRYAQGWHFAKALPYASFVEQLAGAASPAAT